MPRRLLVRFGILVLLVVGGLVALRLSPLGHHLNEKDLVGLFARVKQSPWAPAVLLLAYLILCPIGLPASPLMIAGAVLFGTVWGSIWNLTGTILGGSVTYFLGRLLGREFVAHFAGKGLKKIEQQVSRRGFWGLVGIRFLPIPFGLINYTEALTGVAPPLFLTTMILGLTPPNILYTYFTAELYNAAGGERSHVYINLAIASGLLAILMFLPPFITGRKRKRRYEEIREQRRGRAGRKT